MRKLIALSLVTLLLSGCAVGPNYKRPSVNVPGAYRGAAPPEAAPPSAESIGDQKWWEIFKDPQLQELIHAALEKNYDVRIAATRILEAQAQVGITRADQLPTISGGVAAANQRSARSKLFSAYETSSNQVDLSLAWELDFWGKYRRATESARANLLATQWAREAVISTLVSDVAAAYFQLRELDLELEISRRTLASRRDSLQLTQTLANGGSTSLLDVRQAEQLVFTAAETIPDLERRIEQQENFISTLLGNNPGPIARGTKLTEQPHAPEIPAGLPSSLLERRPDIREAEAQLIAANAQIGVAKADYFPQINLTASGGYQSSALTGLFSGPAGLWSFGGSLLQPIFTGGKIRSNVKFSEARQQEAALVYQQTIQQAFRGVSDALVEYRKDREFREQQEQLTFSAQDAARLSETRYRGGATSYLEVLTNETNYFDAELGLAQAQLNELLGLVRMYRSLGGGWQEP
ncbi:MAG TPA: efflux transporter outer membrane subunit [Candidatus Saccharimonadales bacterium]|nr:efflux transporter outer membrane subunit [Candidatus Saccharimonadales bacterium]